MKKQKVKRISVLEWELMVNTIGITKQNNEHLDVLMADSMQTMEDTSKQQEKEFAIKTKYDRTCYSRK